MLLLIRIFPLQDKEMVRLLLEMKAGLDTVMDEAFARDERFGHALKEAFEHFVNQRANRCPVIQEQDHSRCLGGLGSLSNSMQLIVQLPRVLSW